MEEGSWEGRLALARGALGAPRTRLLSLSLHPSLLCPTFVCSISVSTALHSSSHIPADALASRFSL